MAVERASRWWKWVAIAGLLAASSVAVVAAIHACRDRTVRVTDERLLGTWQSDVERTIAGIRERKPVDDKQEAALRKLFGKLRVTYTATTYSTELNGTTETHKYEVLGKDKYSAVTRTVERKPSPLDDVMGRSEFTVIHFDGTDCYWVYAHDGGIREYFKRVR